MGSTKPTERAHPLAAPPAAVGTGWQDRFGEIEEKVQEWSSRMRECVLTPPADAAQAADHENFERCRNYRVESVHAAYRRGGLDALCDAVEQHMDRPACGYGNCGEAAYVFACAARRIGIRDDQIQIWTTPNDHMFVTVPNPRNPRERCLLDRWTITDTAQVGRGRVICPVAIVAGTVHVAGKPSRNAWYQRLSGATMRDHFALQARDTPARPTPIEDTWDLVDSCVPGATYQKNGMTCTLRSCRPVRFPESRTPAGLQAGRTYYVWTSQCAPNDPPVSHVPPPATAPAPRWSAVHTPMQVTARP